MISRHVIFDKMLKSHLMNFFFFSELKQANPDFNIPVCTSCWELVDVDTKWVLANVDLKRSMTNVPSSQIVFNMNVLNSQI